MILQNSFDVLNSITDYLEENKIILSPLENTYLSSLFESSWALPIEGVPSLQESAHDVVQDKIIQVLTNSIIGQLNFSRNEVVPAVDAFYEKLMNSIKAYSSGNPLLEISIVPRSMPEIVHNTEFMKIMGSYENIMPVEPIQVSGNPNVTDEIMNRVREAARQYYDENYSGVNGLDGVKNGTDAGLFYAVTTLTNKIAATQNHDVVDEALLKYFLADIFSKNEALAVDLYGLQSLDGLRNILMSIKQYALTMLARNKDIIEGRDNNGKGLLILNYDKVNRTIFVSKVVYENFINAGGTPETILGVFANNKASPTDYFYENLLSMKEKYLGYFHQFSQIEEENRKLNYFDSFKTFFKILFLSDVSTYTDAEKEYHNLNPGATEKIIQLLDEKLQHLVMSDIDNPKSSYKTVFRIIATTRYYYTDAYTLLKYIDDEHADGKDISSTVAIAVVYYLVDYFVDQFFVYTK